MNSIAINSSTKKTSIEWVVLIFIALCSLLTGVVPQTLLSFFVLLACFVLFFIGKLFAAYPFMIFYYEMYGKLLGLSVYRIFSLLFLLSVLMRINTKKRVKISIFVPAGIYFLYCLFVMTNYSTQRAVFSFVDVICSILIVSETISKDKDKMKFFFKIYVLVCFVAFVSGAIGANATNYEMAGVEMSRFQATFEDPNYMGFFYTIGIFSMLTLKLFSKAPTIILTIALYAIVFSSLSVTAFLLNVILWMLYLFVFQKKSLKTFLAFLLMLVAVLGLYNYGIKNPQTTIIGPLTTRIEEKLVQASEGDIGNATTGRTNLTQAHIEYFESLPLSKKLFGGTAVNFSVIDPAVEGAAHNEYVDMLLNIGILGTTVIIFWVLFKLLHHCKEYQRTKDEIYMCTIMNNCIWLAYAASLTIFLDYRFMLPFFL